MKKITVCKIYIISCYTLQKICLSQAAMKAVDCYVELCLTNVGNIVLFMQKPVSWAGVHISSLNAKVAIIQKPVNWFAEQRQGNIRKYAVDVITCHWRPSSVFIINFVQDCCMVQDCWLVSLLLILYRIVAFTFRKTRAKLKTYVDYLCNPLNWIINFCTENMSGL